MEEDLVKHLKKTHGEETAFVLSEDTHLAEGQLFVPSGVAAVDYVLRLPGFPIGRVIEVTGEVSTGKTFLGLSCLKETVNLGGNALFIDFEHTLNAGLLELAKLDAKESILLQPSCLEEAFECINSVVEYVHSKKDKKLTTIVLDSLAAAPMKAEVEGTYQDSLRVGAKARFLSAAFRKVTKDIADEKLLFIVINQMREKVGVMFGPTWTTPGGLALQYHASIRLLLHRKGDLKTTSSEVCGLSLKVTALKNKLAPPLKSADFDFRFDTGVNNVKSFLQILMLDGVLSKSGSTYIYKNKGYKASSLIEMLLSNTELKKEAEKCEPYLYQTYISRLGSSTDLTQKGLQEDSETT